MRAKLVRESIDSDGQEARWKAANEKVHPVETEWHYPILTKYGFFPITKNQTGLVRAYDYEDKNNHKIRCSTGANADHWKDETTGKYGFWMDLEPHLKSLTA